VPYINQPGGSGGGGHAVGFEFGYTQITAPVNITSTTEATGTTLIAAGAIVFDGSPVLAQFFCPALKADNSATGDFTIVSLFEGATQISRLCLVEAIATFAPNNYTVSGFFRFTPTAASHTYTVTASTSVNSNASAVAGSGGVGGYPPAYIRFTKV
jgi:hypothetical protein